MAQLIALAVLLAMFCGAFVAGYYIGQQDEARRHPLDDVNFARLQRRGDRAARSLKKSWERHQRKASQ